MHLFEQMNVCPPRPVGPIHRAFQPITSLQWERSFFFSQNSTPHDIFPIRTVNHNFPNIMPRRRRPPRHLFNRQAPDRTAKIGAMPCSIVVRLIDDLEENCDFVGAALLHRLSFSRDCMIPNFSRSIFSLSKMIPSSLSSFFWRA